MYIFYNWCNASLFKEHKYKYKIHMFLCQENIHAESEQTKVGRFIKLKFLDTPSNDYFNP